jgi:glycosyltransferase involved in cell wall biosynthesis
MRFLTYADASAANIQHRLGTPDYSYYFAMKEFLPALRQLGDVQVIADVQTADRHYDDCGPRREPCVLVSFCPPHRLFLPQRCPVIPVFAWEYDRLPDEVWDGEPRHDWVATLRRAGLAVVHSRHTAAAVRRQLGDSFPVAAIPCPVWDRFESVRQRHPAQPCVAPTRMTVDGPVLDTRTTTDEFLPAGAIAGYGPGWAGRVHAAARHLRACRHDLTWDLLSPRWADRVDRACGATAGWLRRRPQSSVARPVDLALDGVVYTSVFNPNDGRKNWVDMVLAFCEALAAKPDATLVLKFTHRDPEFAFAVLNDVLHRVRPFQCRVVALSAFLDDPHYERLVAASTYAVNSSHGEGQCLPLMEFMACGRPAIAPDHTAMGDYVDAHVAFVIESDLEPCTWPQDRRARFRAHRHRLNWMSLVRCFEASYHTARNDPEGYRTMAEEGQRRQQTNCSLAAATARLRQFLDAAAVLPGRAFNTSADAPSC